jgi:uncharacterized damage-inducible protein DinB
MPPRPARPATSPPVAPAPPADVAAATRARRAPGTGRQQPTALGAAAPAAAAPAAAPAFDAAPAVLHAWATSDAITRYLIEQLDDAAWQAAPPGGKGRTIAAIAAHVHNVRVMWLKAADRGNAPPAQLDRHTVTRADALAALAGSHAALRRVMAGALAADGRVKGFKPDVVGFLGYLVAHEAHHRGQMSMLARQLGHPIPQAAMFGMWEWGSRGRGLEGAAD